MASIRYMRVMGRLGADRRLTLRPGYLSDRPRFPEQARDSAMFAELLDSAGNLLLRHPLRLQPMCGDGATLPYLTVRGWVPFHPDTRLIRFNHVGQTLQEIRVSEHSPEIRLNWRPSAAPSGIERVTWDASHAEGRQLQFLVRFTHTDGASWIRLGWRTGQPWAEVDFSRLPGGERCRVAVVATDGINTTIAESATFRLPVQPCRAMILAPESETVASVGGLVLLRGQGYWLEESRPETEQLAWSSSVEGELGRGTVIEWRPRRDGEHRVTLTAGTGERQGSAEILIQVRRHADPDDVDAKDAATG